MWVSNVPISRPINTLPNVQHDFGGIGWTRQTGFVFKHVNDYEPFEKPIHRGDYYPNGW